MVSWMTKTTSFDGDLADQEKVRAKLADVEAKIEQRERLRERVEEDLERLERLRQGLLVILGDKEPESDQARAERLEKRRWQVRALASHMETGRAAATIQEQVESLVDALERPVSAGELLEHLPTGTKRETVNWALWSAAEKGRIRRISQGVYDANPTFAKASPGRRR
jgi:DNA-binding FrmR family transcriptional regulator